MNNWIFPRAIFLWPFSVREFFPNVVICQRAPPHSIQEPISIWIQFEGINSQIRKSRTSLESLGLIFHYINNSRYTALNLNAIQRDFQSGFLFAANAFSANAPRRPLPRGFFSYLPWWNFVISFNGIYIKTMRNITTPAQNSVFSDFASFGGNGSKKCVEFAVIG